MKNYKKKLEKNTFKNSEVYDRNDMDICCTWKKLRQMSKIPKIMKFEKYLIIIHVSKLVTNQMLFTICNDRFSSL